jgi:hypothetical protein
LHSRKLKCENVTTFFDPKLAMLKFYRFATAVSTTVLILTTTCAAESSASKLSVSSPKIIVDKSIANYAKAQNQIPQYQPNLAYAQQQSQNSSKFHRAVVSLDLATPSSLTNIASGKTSTSVVATRVALASHLKQLGAKFYGTFWCPYCNQQKKMFGEPAFRQINYIECDARGNNPRPDLCIKARISGFPTWEINGKQYQGMKSLDELADLSGYRGERNFGN